MSIRETSEYKAMTPYSAIGFAEGFEVPGEEEDAEMTVLAAWQYIYDHKLYLSLQGWFGRSVEALLEQGVIEK
jgi:hypothetical protein